VTGLSHLDESGEPCKRHPPGDLETLLYLAAIGARAASYNHDIASKIQGVMMAVDEIAELEGNPDVQRAAQTAVAALGELNQLLQQSRALAKPPAAKQIALGELVTRAAQRVGVTVTGTLPDATIDVAVPLVTQGLALAIDAVAGTERRRIIEPRAEFSDGHISLAIPFAPTTAPNLGDSLAIASWIMTREGGELRCGATELTVRFPRV
jgi:hypothetical protein